MIVKIKNTHCRHCEQITPHTLENLDVSGWINCLLCRWKHIQFSLRIKKTSQRDKLVDIQRQRMISRIERLIRESCFG